MLLVVGSTGEKPPAGDCGFLFSFRPTMRRGKRAADTQNHTALQRARNRNENYVKEKIPANAGKELNV